MKLPKIERLLLFGVSLILVVAGVIGYCRGFSGKIVPLLFILAFFLCCIAIFISANQKKK